MKLIDLKCNQCGADLKVNEELTKCVCQYCGNEMLIDNEVIEHKITNGYDFGYEQEKGRQQFLKDEAEKVRQQQILELQLKQKAILETRNRNKELIETILNENAKTIEYRDLRNRYEYLYRSYSFAWKYFLIIPLPLGIIFFLIFVILYSNTNRAIFAFWAIVATIWAIGIGVFIAIKLYQREKRLYAEAISEYNKYFDLFEEQKKISVPLVKNIKQKYQRIEILKKLYDYLDKGYANTLEEAYLRYDSE